MQLAKLEIKGFKSFADKIVINFDEGITGIVGPNGCGKSNVVDSIRWVLGEQSMRQLRGKKSDDIIFIGGHGKAALGMAEQAGRRGPLARARERQARQEPAVVCARVVLSLVTPNRRLVKHLVIAAR